MRISAVLLLALGALSAGCADSALVDPPAGLTPLSATQRTVVETDNAFGLTLFQELAADNQDNVFISPTSVSFALGMTANGAAGTTYDQMVTTLGKDGLSPEAVNESYRDLSAMLVGMDPEVRLQIANSIWYRQGYPVRSEFLETNRSYFHADVEEADFGDPATPGRINGWVEDKTNGLIDKVIDQIPGSVVMYLINAIYFKGTWLYEFDPQETTSQSFFNADGTTSTVPLMAQQADLPYLVTDDYQAVDLPYGDSLFSMTVVLPSGDRTTGQVLAGLTSSEIAGWGDQFQTEDVILMMPRFKVGYKESLKSTLAAMGMPEAFQGGRADFSRLVEGGGPWIDNVIHQAVIDVNEEGTEAAAVTVVIIVESAGAGPKRVRLDRPFLLFIRERHTGSVLFMGRIAQL